MLPSVWDVVSCISSVWLCLGTKLHFGKTSLTFAYKNNYWILSIQQMIGVFWFVCVAPLRPRPSPLSAFLPFVQDILLRHVFRSPRADPDSFTMMQEQCDRVGMWRQTKHLFLMSWGWKRAVLTITWICYLGQNKYFHPRNHIESLVLIHDSTDLSGI